MFSMPDHLIPDVKQLERMNRDIHALLPAELASTVNMMAHPAASLAAASALGFGLAGHAFGVWMGAFAGAAEFSQRLLERFEGEAPKATKELVPGIEPAEAVLEPAKPSVLAEPAAGAMPDELRQPRAAERPGQPDDLKKISGIGPKLEAVLNGLGIWTYAQIAAWTPAEVAWIDDYLSFKGRIGRDGWMKQAKALAGTETKH